jgi:hypothetical protein
MLLPAAYVLDEAASSSTITACLLFLLQKPATAAACSDLYGCPVSALRLHAPARLAALGGMPIIHQHIFNLGSMLAHQQYAALRGV